MQKMIGCALLMLCTLNSIACDICGSASSGSQLGILPQFKKHFIGLMYQSNAYDSRPHDGITEQKTETVERFQTTGLWGRAVIRKKLQVFAFLPYKFNSRNTAGGHFKVSGMGDALLLMNATVLTTTDRSNPVLKHVLQLGTGIKLPTGNYDRVQNGLMLHTNIQTGTGSFDIPVNLIYTVRYKSYGANTELNFTRNGINKQHFQFGDRAAASVRIFAWKNVKKLNVLPAAGLTYEFAGRDRQNNEFQDYTGGQNLLGNAGLDIYYNRLGLNLLFQRSVYQDIGDGYIKNRARMSANFIYLF